MDNRTQWSRCGLQVGPGYQATRNYFEEVPLPISLPVLQRHPSVTAHSSPVTEFQLQRCNAKTRGLPKTRRVGRISLVWKSNNYWAEFRWLELIAQTQFSCSVLIALEYGIRRLQCEL